MPSPLEQKLGIESPLEQQVAEEKISLTDALKILRRGNVLTAARKKFTFDYDEDGLTQAELYGIAEEHGISCRAIDEARKDVILDAEEKTLLAKELGYTPTKDRVEKAYSELLLSALKEHDPGTRFVTGIDTYEGKGGFFWLDGWLKDDLLTSPLESNDFYELQPKGTHQFRFSKREHYVWEPIRHGRVYIYNGVDVHAYTSFFAKACADTLARLQEHFPKFEQNLIQEF